MYVNMMVLQLQWVKSITREYGGGGGGGGGGGSSNEFLWVCKFVDDVTTMMIFNLCHKLDDVSIS